MTIKFDDLLYQINDFGKFQKIRYILICLAGILPPIATYIHSFLAALPEFTCNNVSIDKTNSNITNLIKSNCVYHVGNGSYTSCDSWSYDKKYFDSTLTEEWNMVCDRSFLRSKVQSIYFCGYLVGSLMLGNLADKFGRRPVMLFSFFLILIGFIGTTFGPQQSYGFLISYIIYSISRFLMACGTRGINETGYVLALELVSTKKRTYAGIGFENFFSLGQLILVLVAYFVRDWRNLSMIFTFAVIPFLTYFFILPESPRWLILNNKQDKALEVLEKVAKVNKKTLNKSSWNEFLNQSHKTEKKENFLTLVKSFIKYPNMAVLFFTVLFNWLVNNFVFYGVSLKSIDLGVNPYLSFAISASVEILAYFSTILLIEKFGRKIPYLTFLLCAGLSCLSHVFITQVEIGLLMAMIGKFCVSASYAILRLYSNEVFPTSIRTSCIGICSMFSRIGVILAPFIIQLGENGWRPMPFLIFGICAVSGACSTIFLPETLNRKLPETIEEAQSFKKEKTKLKHDISVEAKLINETVS
ncbi:unnamed protein product [Brachionus calyciflorus]|uniref:Major facilitator superfamily (MFS) profile domain-containing protein n=1 Tax=Brachionus calyciflorus TaxID=104777 RepID=A0A813SIC6_9BILA|nr:unnamed protein product [Brachionus calyciflorus]